MTEIDKRNKLDEEVFSYRAGKDGKVFLSWRGKEIKILKASEAAKFLARIEGMGHKDGQLIMAKVTGNFKHGNER